MSASLSIVWFKRDLRVHDHAPLTRACEAARESGGAVLCVYLFEPSVIAFPDYAAQHLAFINESLTELEAALAKRGGSLVRCVGEAVDVFARISTQHRIHAIYSHEETGNGITYARDIAVGNWAQSNGIAWHEFPQTGVVRRLKTRNGWAGRWERYMRAEKVVAPDGIPSAQIFLSDDIVRFQQSLAFVEHDKPQRQRGGRAAAIETLRSFLAERGRTYQRGMSSPNTAPHVCSRLSPYLALGVVSMREVTHRLYTEQAHADDKPSGFKASMRSFEGRLHWHCHFVQKLESEPAMEFHALMPALDAVRPRVLDAESARRLHAWQTGTTGYPLVDACMRSLNATGWLTFRMRAMVTSFAAYNLWLDWRDFAHFLARAFLDYEPGIHYAQLQMQSGVTGINALRIYNVTKQAQEHDAEGTFIKKWCPELAHVPSAQLFTPWLCPELCPNYPPPIVDWVTSYRFAREQFGLLRRSVEVKEQAGEVMEKHGSRKSGMRASSARTGTKKKQIDAAQGVLFGDPPTRPGSLA